MATKPKGTPNGDAAMTFAQIAEQTGLSLCGVIRIYHRAIGKLRNSAAAVDSLTELAEYHRQLRARSAECRAAQEHW